MMQTMHIAGLEKRKQAFCIAIRQKGSFANPLVTVNPVHLIVPRRGIEWIKWDTSAIPGGARL
jgi:hypothetical protein